MIATAIDVILVLVPLEAAGLVLWFRRTGQGIPPRRLLANIAAGFSLMLGVRLALAEAGDGPIAACLFIALLAHLLDLASRWQTRSPAKP
jgi:hypothetical protein